MINKKMSIGTEIKATYRVTTPMFCGGAENQAELRLQSFKGVLRYWWRALAWSRLNGKLNDIRKEENSLFGSSDEGQSRISMRLELGVNQPKPSRKDKNEILTVPTSGRRVVGEGARYLGYGVMDTFNGKKTKAGKLIRSCLNTPFDFTVCMLAYDQDGKPECVESLKDALIALGTFGGMGAKSRKGYGSLVIQSLLINGREEYEAPQSINELKDKIRNLRKGTNVNKLPEFTALSENTRHLVLSSDKKEPLEMLDLIGRELIRYRSWGYNGKILGNEKSEKNFKNDHDLMKKNSGERNHHPKRVAFGLPHNYGKNQEVRPAEKKYDRRASPLFVHIHEFENAPVAVLSFFPTKFLPEGKRVILVGGEKVCQIREEELYEPIHRFFDRLLDPNKRKEPFEAEEVKS